MLKPQEKKIDKAFIAREIVNCSRDVKHFIGNYCMISHPTKGLIPFKLFKYQEKLLDDCIRHKYNIILKARQLGISTVTSAYIAWKGLFFENQNILLIATKQDTAINLLNKVKTIIHNLPPFLQLIKVKTDNKTSIGLTNGSVIKVSAASADAGRSEALSLLVIDEAAHIENFIDLWTGLKPTLATGGDCIALSSPCGVGNWFHKTYSEAEMSINNFNPIKIMWYEHPDYDEEWFKNETKDLGKKEIAQEYLCSFNMSGETFFDAEEVEKVEKACREPIRKLGIDRNLWIWEMPQEEEYLVAVDVSRGDSSDYSVLHVLKMSTMEVVAEYQGKMSTDVFSSLVKDTGLMYNTALVVVENNGPGWAVLDYLKNEEYKNLYYSRKTTNEFIEQYLAETTGEGVAGFSTTSKTRPLILAKLEEAIRNNKYKPFSKRFLHEMKTFVWTNGKPQALKYENDDLIMAAAIGLWVKEQIRGSFTKDSEIKKAMASCFLARTKSSSAISTESLMNYAKRNMAEKKNDYRQYAWILRG